MITRPLPTRLAIAAIGIGLASAASLPGAVTNTNDNGPGSLRQTMADAPAGATITFDPALSGQTITLGTGQLLIDKDLAIDASALPNGIAIDANGEVTEHRVMEVTSGVTVSLTKLHLTGGKATVDISNDSGGGIHNSGTLTLIQSTLSYNSAIFLGGGIYNSGTLTLNESTLSGNSALEAGGIANSGTLILNQSTLSDNSADYDYGGGISNSGTLTLNQSTLSGNFTNSDGGGIYNVGTLTLNQSTLSGNSAGGAGGGIYNDDTLTLNQSTLSGNSASFGGGGIFNYENATLLLTNSIVADNTGDNIDGSVTTENGNNLTSGDPLLSPLGDYGGPTQTRPPLPGSPAIDAATVTDPAITADQRGAPRPNGLLPDIGAVEYQPAIVNTAADQNDSPEGPELSLREALAREFVSTITFAPALDDQTITLTGGQLLIDKDLAIDASALPAGITIDANGEVTNHRVMEVVFGVTVSLTRLHLTGSDASADSGGGIHNSGTLTLNQCILSGNSAEFGGGIYNLSGTLTLNQTTLSENSTYLDGGGIYNSSGMVTLNQTTLSGNSAFFGGGILNSDGMLTLNQATLSGNSAYFDGGGIQNSGTVTLNESTIVNSSAATGGGISNSGTVTLNESTLSGNSATLSEFSGGGSGGGIQNSGTVTLNHSTLSGNSASNNGGGISNQENSTLSLTNSIVAGNTAPTNDNISGSFTPLGNNLTTGAPLLTPLGNYGGPTQTMPPLPGSPAIDAATVSDPPVTADQRGAPRPSGPLPDIGAVEYQPAIVNTAADQNDSPEGPELSLREALARVFVSTITFAPALDDQTITLTGGQLLIDKDLAIDASALPAGITIDANGEVTEHRVMEVISGVTVSLTKLHLTGGKVSSGGGGIFGDGGGIFNSGNLKLNLSSVSGNSAFFGGGIYNVGALTLNQSTLSWNSTYFDGGGIFNAYGTLTLNQSTLSDNSANFDGGGGTVDYGGGGINNFSGTLILNQSTLSNNSAGAGAGIANSGTLSLHQSTLSGNSAVDDGGGIFNILSGTAILIESTLSNNAADYGGGIMNFNTLTLNNSTLSGNSADYEGGGIANSGTLTVTNSIIAGNTASSDDNISGSFTPLGNNLTTGDPLLTPLGNYGGPTQTMPPLPGSPAIDAATVSDPPVTADQRGFARPNGPLPDIGAVEAYPFSFLGLADTDNDGIPDVLESPDGPYPQFTVGIDDSALDSDGDGQTDAAELAAMTNPLDPNDFFRILSFTPAAGFHPQTNPIFDITVKTFPGVNYLLERQSNLGQPFDPLDGGTFTAIKFSETFQIELLSGRDFVRARTLP